MRIFRLLLIMLMLPLMAGAAGVPVKEAEHLAVNFYYSRITEFRNVAFTDIRVTDCFTKAVDNTAVYYVFNMSTGGFVVVSADDRIIPVLAYAFDNCYKTDGQPEAFVHWMKDYEIQIAWAVTHNYPQRKDISNEWERLQASDPYTLKSNNGKSVLPLLHTTWDQGKYYNAYCPAGQGGPDGHAWAGCVPTAMAQIMNYYRWPEQGTGNYTYVHPTYGTLSADFGNTQYNWDEMPLKLTRYNDALAELLFHLGVSVDLDYGSGGSGMFNHKAAWSLRNYFKYDASCEYIFRDTCTQNWKAIILSHLNDKKPLYYAGWADTMNVSGHAFVCDGYQDTTYFHFNWGWSGSYDGYFMIDNLTPGGSDFTLDHELIVNFFPDTASGYPAGCNGSKNIQTQWGSLSDGSGPLNDYACNLNCEWLIAPADSVNSITLNFLEFSTQAGSDIVTVYDGATTGDPVLGVFSGSSLPAQVTSSGNKMLVRFTTDNDTVFAGWLATFTSSVPQYCSGLTDMTDPTGTLSDGSGNTQNYHGNSLCRWRIQPPGATSVTLHFNSFDLASGDNLEVTSLPDGLVLLQAAGDSVPADVTSPTGKMMVIFQSDGQHTAAGWEAVYSSVSGLEESVGSGGISIYPNPAGDHVTLSAGFDAIPYLIISLQDITGRTLIRKVYENIAGYFVTELDISELSSGIYILTVETPVDNYFTKLVHQYN